MTYEEKKEMRESVLKHLGILLEKVHKMFDASGELSIQQMSVGADILKDIAKADAALSKACYYDSKRGDADDKRY